MHFALVGSQRLEATPGAVGRCPLCHGQVVARCGQINSWHWAHRYLVDCDAWSEGEGSWHLEWKRRFPPQWREFVMGRHRADLRVPQGVVELQTSPISIDEVAEREVFYGNMVWLVDARDFNLDLRDHNSYVTFRWKHPRKTWWCARKPLFFDLGDRLLQVHRIHHDIPCGGWGRIITYDFFVQQQSRPKAGEALCEDCKMPSKRMYLIETGMWEYYTLDLDPQTLLCPDCHETRCDTRTPDDPALFDCWTPVHVT
jgi:competence protein CoiA